MQLFNINSNIFQNTLIDEYASFRSDLKNRGDMAEDVSTYSDGNILFSIAQQSSAFNRLLTDEWNVTNSEDKAGVVSNYITAEYYMDDVTDTIIKSEQSFYLNDALKQVGEIVEAVGDKLAGILLVQGKTIVNPLHPLAALVLMDEMDELSFQSFKIITYLYKDKKLLEEMYGSSDANPERVKANVLSLISMYSNKKKVNKAVRTVQVNKIDENIPLSNIYRFYKESIFTGNDLEGDFVVIPHQILTKGIVAPYYGTSIILREENNAKGAFVTPFQSANVSSPAREENNSNPEFGSVCTGSSDKTTIKGLRTLVHSNLSSPLNSQCIGLGAIAYADECIRQSINLYTLGGFIDEIAEEADVETTDTQLYEEDDADRAERELAERESDEELANYIEEELLPEKEYVRQPVQPSGTEGFSIEDLAYTPPPIVEPFSREEIEELEAETEEIDEFIRAIEELSGTTAATQVTNNLAETGTTFTQVYIHPTTTQTTTTTGTAEWRTNGITTAIAETEEVNPADIAEFQTTAEDETVEDYQAERPRFIHPDFQGIDTNETEEEDTTDI